MVNTLKSKTKTWNGIPRSQIKWHPIIDKNKCTQCLTCVSFCKQGVYEEKEGKPVVVNPLNCVVGCVGCESICPNQAIRHPPKDYLEKLAGKEKPTVSCCSVGKCCSDERK